MKNININGIDYKIYENCDLKLSDYFKIMDVIHRREELKQKDYMDGTIEIEYVERGYESENFKIKRDVDLALIYTNIPRSILEDCYELVIYIVNNIEIPEYEFNLPSKIEKNRRFYNDGEYLYLDINYLTFQQWADIDLQLQNTEKPYAFMPIFMFKRPTQEYNRYERYYNDELTYIEKLPLSSSLPIYLHYYNDILAVRQAFKYIYHVTDMPPTSDVTTNTASFNKSVGWEKTILDIAKEGYFNGKNGTLEATRNANFAKVLEIVNIQAGASRAQAWDYYETQEKNKKKNNV